MQVEIAGPVGTLEGVLEEPEALRAVSIVAHPHPLHGGTMRNTIVVRVARALRNAGFATLRFNFRGVEKSEGIHSGDLEVEDAAACLAHLRERHPGLPAWVAGYSFGARIVAELAAREPAVESVVLIALPVGLYGAGVLRELDRPGLIVLGGADRFGTRADLERALPRLGPGMRVEEVPQADHFFRGRTPRVEEIVHDYARSALEPRRAR